MPLKSVTIVGISLLASDMPSSWQQATFEACNLTSPESVEWFANAKDLSQLRISQCQLSSESIQVLAERPNVLQSLDLSNNILDPKECATMSQWLDSSPSLVDLSLSDNSGIGNLGIQALCTTFSHTIQ